MSKPTAVVIGVGAELGLSAALWAHEIDLRPFKEPF